MAQSTNITAANFARGIHARVGENKIPEGFTEDLLNVDAIGQQLRKRTGFVGYAGCLPHRVSSMIYTASGDEIRLSFDAIVDLSSTTSSPLLVYGRSSNLTSGANGGDFGSTDSLEYYTSFTPEVKDILTSPSGTLTKTLSQRPITDTIYTTHVSESTSLTNNSWEAINLDTEQQIKANDNLNLDYTIFSDTDVFVYYVGKTAIPGSVYVDDVLSIDGSGNATITALTHGLDNFNITAAFYEDSGTEWERVYPNTTTLNQSTGQLDVNFSTLASTTVRVILTAVGVNNTLTEGTTVGSTTTFTISSPQSPWIVATCYEDTGGSYEEIYPNSITYDAATDEINIEFIGINSPVVFYEYGSIAANSLTVVANNTITSDGSDSSPQLTVWGLCHEDTLYGGTKTQREGWTTHLDSYRSVAQERLVSSVSGALYSEHTRSEAGTTYGMPLLYPALRERTDGTERTIGPLFQTTNSAGIASGYLYSSDVSSDYELEIESLTYNGGTGYVDVLINASGVEYLDASNIATTLSAILTTGTSQLTVASTEHPRNSGIFTIEAVSETSSDTFTLSISNSQVENSLWDEVDVGGMASITTDQLTTSSSSLFIPGDTLSSSAFSSDLTCLNVSATTVHVSGVVSNQLIEANVRIVGSRTSSAIPTRNSVGTTLVSTSTNAGFVAGDTVGYTTEAHDHNIAYVNAEADEAVTLSDDGTTLTISGVSATSRFNIGQTIILAQAGDYTGEHTITAIDSPTDLTAASASTGSGSGTLVGYVVELDYPISWADTTANSASISVDRRWTPVEAPDATDSLPATTHTYYFNEGTVANRPFIRSTIVNNNMYFTTGQSPVMKYDGTDVYRAGFFRWQPEAFITLDTTGGTIPVVTTSQPYTASEGNVFTTASGDETSFSIGQKVEDDTDNERYTITEIDDSKVKGDRPISGGGTGNISVVQVFSYYYRLNAFDANNNIIASATTASQDYRVEVGTDAAIKHRLLGFPVWDVYDYDRIELEAYRSRADEQTEYRRVITLPVSFENSNGYLDFTDTVADDVWGFLPLDPVSSALLGAELGTTWDQPQRSKYLTSANNQLILGNVRSYPRLDVQIVNEEDEIATSDLAGDIWYFKRQNTLGPSTTDMLEHVKLEWLNSGETTIDPDPGGAGDIATTSSTFTITEATHGLVAGDWIYLFHSAVVNDNDPTFSGWWQIASTNTNDFTINFDGHGRGAGGGTAADVDRYISATAPADIPVWLGVDGNRDYISGNTSIDKLDAMARLAQALNASMRMTDTSISGFETFTPWLIASAGGDYAAGQIIIEQPNLDSTLDTDEAFELDTPSFSGYKVFVDGINRAASTSVQASELLFPSRLLVSYPNYPELFDAPLSTLPSQSDSVIDVNPSDGQQITGLISFFGDSSFGDSQKEGMVVVFKTNSIYLVNVARKAQGAFLGLSNPVQKIDSRGLGCTAPYSIAYTRNGIIFANESGLYRLNQDLTIEYVGEYMERRWQEDVNKDYLSIAQGHHASRDNKYKISVPVNSATSNSEVYVYNHAQEKEVGAGAWSRYDSHNATGWANLGAEAFFGSTNGRVLRIRNEGVASDFRDDNGAIDASITLRAEDFGLSGVRKLITKLLVDLRIPYSFSSTVVKWATDMKNAFTTLASFSASSGDRSVGKFRFDLDDARGSTFQIKVENSGIDEPLELTGVDYKVVGLSSQGTDKASEFES